MAHERRNYSWELITEFNRRQGRWIVHHRRDERIEDDANEHRNSLLGSHVMQIFRHSHANIAGDQKQFRDIRQNY